MDFNDNTQSTSLSSRNDDVNDNSSNSSFEDPDDTVVDNTEMQSQINKTIVKNPDHFISTVNNEFNSLHEQSNASTRTCTNSRNTSSNNHNPSLNQVNVVSNDLSETTAAVDTSSPGCQSSNAKADIHSNDHDPTANIMMQMMEQIKHLQLQITENRTHQNAEVAAIKEFRCEIMQIVNSLKGQVNSQQSTPNKNHNEQSNDTENLHIDTVSNVPPRSSENTYGPFSNIDQSRLFENVNDTHICTNSNINQEGASNMFYNTRDFSTSTLPPYTNVQRPHAQGGLFIPTKSNAYSGDVMINSRSNLNTHIHSSAPIRYEYTNLPCNAQSQNHLFESYNGQYAHPNISSSIQPYAVSTTSVAFQQPKVTPSTQFAQTQSSAGYKKLQGAANPTHNTLSMSNNVPGTPIVGTSEIHPETQFHHRRKLLDLPEFNGKPEQWPLFYASFVETTKAFAYSDLENNVRLQKCLKGDAKVAVESLLIYPHNTNEVISQLEFLYGRADCLIRSQIQLVRKIGIIDDNHIDQIIPFATKVKNLVTFLETTNSEQHIANPILLDELINKLPMNKRLDWASFSINIKPYPTIRHFGDWISQMARLVSTISNTSISNNRFSKKTVLYANQTDELVTTSCTFCKSNHFITKCDKFKQLSIDERWIFVKKNRLCFSCLRTGHNIFKCFKKISCKINDCRRYHHELLHTFIDEVNKVNTESQAQSNSPSGTDDSLANIVLSCHPELKDSEEKIRVLFKIVPVKVYGNRTFIETFALIDEGSSVSLMDESIANELNLQEIASEPLNLQWFGNITSTQPSKLVNVDVCGISKGCSKMSLKNIRTVKNLQLPLQSLDIDQIHSRYHYMKNLPIVSYENAIPKLLIGIDNSHVGFVSQSRKGKCINDPIVIHTKLGWIVYGNTTVGSYNQINHTFLIHEGEEDLKKLHEIVNDYFTTENFGVIQKDSILESHDVIRARQIMQNTTRLVDQHYETGLLWKTDKVDMPNSFSMALNRLYGIEKKIKKDPEYGKKYSEIIESYVLKGYAKKLTNDEAKLITPRTWYLPHFSVVNPAKPNKMRLVFDAAATVNGVSLNSMLLTGPEEYESLTAVLYKFRLRKIAVCGDIREMFHQVHIRSADQDSQRFIWRNESTNEIEIFKMVAMIFGASCSPSIAQYIKNENAKKYMNEYPEAAMSILRNHYVDDYVKSFDDEVDAIKVTKAIIYIHSQAGFELRNFISNCKNVLKELNRSDYQNSIINMKLDDEHQIDKILGLYWCVSTDEFTFELKFFKIDKEIWEDNRCPTKRELLGIAMSIYDPFGFIANFTIYTKIMMQDVWRSGVDWDDSIPYDIYKQWIMWKKELPKLQSFRIPRWYCDGMMNENNVIELHIFVDASELAFSAVAFFRIVFNDGKIRTSFVTGKTKCAPQRLLSIPRLELQSAVLGVRLKNAVIKEHEISVGRIIFCSDSKTVIQWIRSNHRKYKPFVAHRVAEILESTNVSQWKWLPSKMNVADIATRTLYPPIYDINNCWINGPQFLLETEDAWPVEQCFLSNEESCEEIKPKYKSIFFSRELVNIINVGHYSKYMKLLRVTAWILRYMYNCNASFNKKIKRSGELLVCELNEAELLLCKCAQHEHFPVEYSCLKENRSVEKQSEIYQLTPYIDEFGVIRLEGRIDNAKVVPFNTRRPIILPKEHHLTKLIVGHYHSIMHHQNQETTICEIRRKFWIPSIRNIVKKITKNCQVCKINNAQPKIPLMGQLPIDRLTPFVRPFTYTGLDFFGPLFVTIGRKREKRWVALFTCLTIRAVHLEVASNLSTDACILCIRNFINRRGVPIRIRSDNGTNFIGVHHELERVDDFLDHEQMQKNYRREISNGCSIFQQILTPEDAGKE